MLKWEQDWIFFLTNTSSVVWLWDSFSFLDLQELWGRWTFSREYLSYNVGDLEIRIFTFLLSHWCVHCLKFDKFVHVHVQRYTRTFILEKAVEHDEYAPAGRPDPDVGTNHTYMVREGKVHGRAGILVNALDRRMSWRKALWTAVWFSMMEGGTTKREKCVTCMFLLGSVNARTRY